MVNNYLSHQESQRLQEIDRLLESDEQELSASQRQALEEERLAIHRLDRSRDEALETACGLVGMNASCWTRCSAVGKTVTLTETPMPTTNILLSHGVTTNNSVWNVLVPKR